MGPFEMVLIGAGLAMDAGTVSLAASASGYAADARAVFRLSFHFGLFQFFMPLAGWFSGILFVEYVAPFDQWIAFFLLSLVGGRMILAGMNPDMEIHKTDPSRGMTLVMLSIATSIDALAVGVSLAMMGVEILYPSLIIGFVTAGFSLIAIFIGNRIGKLFGQRMEIAGGVMLIAIGLKILWQGL